MRISDWSSDVCSSDLVIAQLYDYEAEVGILGEVPESRDFVVIKLSSTPLIAFTSRAHALSRRRSITLAELAAQMLVLRERGSKTRQSIEAAARAKGLALVPTIEAEGREAVREIVATGGGVGVRSEEHTSELQSLMRIS